MAHIRTLTSRLRLQGWYSQMERTSHCIQLYVNKYTSSNELKIILFSAMRFDIFSYTSFFIF